MNFRSTDRGFAIIEFDDRNGDPCSMQKSSAANSDLFWLGRNTDRMHLSMDDVEKLHAITKVILKTGKLPTREQYEAALNGEEI